MMSSENNVKKGPAVDEKDLENVELHRAESMVNENGELVDQINNVKPKVPTVHEYVVNKARFVGSGLVKLSVEIIMFLYMFSYIMRSVSSATMILEKVCLFHLEYPKDVCSNLKEYRDIKNEVEKMANNYHLGHSLLMMVPSAVLALFMGTWSDTYGRRFPIICALVGVVLDGFGVTLCAYFYSSRVEYYFISALFTGFSGGFICILMVLYSYASDVTPSNKRTMKYAVLEVALGLSVAFGSLGGGYIFKYAGYVPVFLTSTCGHLVGLFWVVFYLEETRGLDNTDTWKQKFVNFWSIDSLVSSFKTTIKKRPNKGRQQIWLIIAGMSIIVLNFAALSGITYYYVHHQYDWENTTFSTVSAIYQVIGLGLMMIIVPLTKKCNIGDPALGVVGSASLLLKNIGTGLAYKTWVYHLSNLLGLLTGLGSLAGRARLSKIVSKDDLGKVFAFMSIAEMILPIVATAIVSQVFNSTLEFFPGLIFVIMGALCIIPLFAFIWIARLPVVSYEEMVDVEAKEGVQTKTEEVMLKSAK